MKGPGPARSGVHRREWKGANHNSTWRGEPSQPWAGGAPPLRSEWRASPEVSFAERTPCTWLHFAGVSRCCFYGPVGLGVVEGCIARRRCGSQCSLRAIITPRSSNVIRSTHDTDKHCIHSNCNEHEVLVV